MYVPFVLRKCARHILSLIVCSIRVVCVSYFICGKMCKTYLDRDYNGLFLLRKCARHISSLRVEKKWARHISSLNVCSIRVEDIGGVPHAAGWGSCPTYRRREAPTAPHFSLRTSGVERRRRVRRSSRRRDWNVILGEGRGHSNYDDRRQQPRHCTAPPVLLAAATVPPGGAPWPWRLGPCC